MMLRPSKHAHPDQTVINVAFLLLSAVRERRVEEYGELLTLAKCSVEGGHLLFLPALNLLYLLGLIEYRRKNDTVEYVGPNATL